MNTKIVATMMFAGLLVIPVLTTTAENTEAATASNQACIYDGVASDCKEGDSPGRTSSYEKIQASPDPYAHPKVDIELLGLDAGATSPWISVPQNETLYVNTAGKPFWVCYRGNPNSEIADNCTHFYTFTYNAYEGWGWIGLGNAYNGFQLRSEVDGTQFRMTSFDGRG